MIHKEECMKTFLKVAPSFEKVWEEYMIYWKGETPGLCTDFSELTDYVEDLIYSIPQPEELLETIFKHIEIMLTEGDEEVQTCVATCFLENLLNNVGHYETKSAAAFIKYLCPESLDYCKENDKFWGTRTRGLYGDEEGEAALEKLNNKP